MAAALSWTVSNAESGVTGVRVASGPSPNLRGAEPSNAVALLRPGHLVRSGLGRITAMHVCSGKFAAHRVFARDR